MGCGWLHFVLTLLHGKGVNQEARCRPCGKGSDYVGRSMAGRTARGRREAVLGRQVSSKARLCWFHRVGVSGGTQGLRLSAHQRRPAPADWNRQRRGWWPNVHPEVQRHTLQRTRGRPRGSSRTDFLCISDGSTHIMEPEKTGPGDTEVSRHFTER